MTRLKIKAELQPIKKFINKYYKNSGKSNFAEFRKAFVKQFENKIKQYPLLEIEMTDLGYENGDGIGLLYEIYSGDLVYELNGSMDQNEIYDNLIENYIHDFWLEIQSLYKTEL